MDHHQANIYKKKKKLKAAGAYSTEHQFYGNPFRFIDSLYISYQLVDALFVVSCDEILTCGCYECISNIFR